MIGLADIYAWTSANWQYLIMIIPAIALIMFVRAMQ